MRYAIIISIIILFFCSCSNTSKNNLEAFRIADEGLQRSSALISSSTHTIYSALESRLGYSDNKERSNFWQSKAIQIKSYCDSFYEYVNFLKETLKEKSGFKKQENTEFYDEENVNAVNKLFDKKSEELYLKLIGFRQNVLAVDNELNKNFSPNLFLFAKGFHYPGNDSKEFNNFFFKDITPGAAMVVLSKFENNVRIAEYNLVMFCLDKTSPVIIHDDFPEPLITQSSKYVKAGEEIQITAGIGIYTTAMKRKIVINNTVISLENEPIGFYKLKASTYPGKHIVPITIEFIQPDGAVLKMQKNIEYIVIDTTK